MLQALSNLIQRPQEETLVLLATDSHCLPQPTGVLQQENFTDKVR